MQDDDEFGRLARTSVDRARVGTLTTYARRPSGQHTTTANVRARVDGSVEVHLAPAAVPVRRLLARPVATLQVAPPWCEPVRLHGAVRRLPGTSERGDLVFHLEIAAVRVGSPAVPAGRGGVLGGRAGPAAPRGSSCPRPPERRARRRPRHLPAGRGATTSASRPPSASTPVA